MNKLDIGLLGEKHIILLLAKIGIDCIKLPRNFSCDLFTSNGIKLEVKTSTIKLEKLRNNRRYWMFSKSKRQVTQEVDYTIFVCLDDKLEVSKVYTVPNSICSIRKVFSIPEVHKRETYNGFSLKEYCNNFNEIFNVTKRNI